MQASARGGCPRLAAKRHRLLEFFTPVELSGVISYTFGSMRHGVQLRQLV